MTGIMAVWEMEVTYGSRASVKTAKLANKTAGKSGNVDQDIDGN